MNNEQNKTILLVEDEKSIRGFIKINLQRNNFLVIEAASGEEALSKMHTQKIDLAILDVMLPGIDGYHVCKEIRETYPSVGIIMLTAKSQDMDKIIGLEFGADDYMIKPFNPLELVLRVKALIRRTSNTANNSNENILTYGPFKIEVDAQKAYKNDIELDLTPKEYMLLKIFIENPGKALKRDDLLDMAWGYNFMGDSKLVDVNIRRLRSKIEDDASNPAFIETVWGTGYRWHKN